MSEEYTNIRTHAAQKISNLVAESTNVFSAVTQIEEEPRSIGLPLPVSRGREDKLCSESVVNLIGETCDRSSNFIDLVSVLSSGCDITATQSRKENIRYQTRINKVGAAGG